MKFSGIMLLMIISKITKKQGFSLSLENAFLEKPQGGGVNSRSLFRFKETLSNTLFFL